MIYAAVIGRINQTIGNRPDWWERQEQGKEVMLIKEDSNAIAPEQAVAAYIDNEKCGYVRSAYVEMVRALIGENDGIGVRLEEYSPQQDSLYVSMESDYEWEEKDYQPKINIDTIAGISLPHLDMARELKVDSITRWCSQIDSVDQIVGKEKEQDALWDSSEWLAEHYGESLSGDDYRAMTLWKEIIDMIKIELDGFEMLDEEAEKTEKSYARLSEESGKIWKEEMKAANRILKAKDGMLTELKMLIERGSIAREQLLEELSAWLKKMPHNLFEWWETDPNRFAQRLFYERLSTRELEAVKIYLCTYTYVRDWKKIEQNENWGAILFNDQVEPYIRANIKREMERFISKPYTTPELVRKIQGLVARGELRSPTQGNMSRYCRGLKEWFGCRFDEANFRKKWRGG